MTLTDFNYVQTSNFKRGKGSLGGQEHADAVMAQKEIMEKQFQKYSK